MRGYLLFEYAVLRVVPRVEREEFINAGIIMYCRQQQFLDVLLTLDEKKLLMIYDKANFNEISEYLNVYLKICRGLPESGPIGRLDLASRFRWLTATRSTIIQTSKVHAGFCEDPVTTLHLLHQKLVL